MTWGQGSTIPKRVKDQVRRRDKTCRLQYPGICNGRIEQFDHPQNLASRGLQRAPVCSATEVQGVCTPCHDHKTKLERIEGQQAAIQRRGSLSRRNRDHETHPGHLPTPLRAAAPAGGYRVTPPAPSPPEDPTGSVRRQESSAGRAGHSRAGEQRQGGAGRSAGGAATRRLRPLAQRGLRQPGALPGGADPEDAADRQDQGLQELEGLAGGLRRGVRLMYGDYGHHPRHVLCTGSEQKPSDEPFMDKGTLRGFCCNPNCGGLYAVCKNGTVRKHQMLQF